MNLLDGFRMERQAVCWSIVRLWPLQLCRHPAREHRATRAEEPYCDICLSLLNGRNPMHAYREPPGLALFWWLRRELADLDRRHPRHSVPVGAGYSGPTRRLYQRCCRCHRFRLLGRFVEMYGPKLGDGWWYECVECALATVTTRWEERIDGAPRSEYDD